MRREAGGQVVHGLTVMWKGESAAARTLRAAALSLVAFAVVTALVGYLAGPWWRLAVSVAGLAGIHVLTRRLIRQDRSQDADDPAGENV